MSLVERDGSILSDEIVGLISTNQHRVIDQLIREDQPGDLNRLEALLAGGYLKESDVIGHLIYDWSRHESDASTKPLPSISRPPLYIQYEGLRDGDQVGAPGVSRLGERLDVAKNIFPILPAYGVTVADLGMPISGAKEQAKILEMMKFISEKGLPITPAVAGRTHLDDVAAITELTRYALQHYNLKTTVYAFVGSSRIRMLAEGQNKWNLNAIQKWLANTIDALKKDPSILNVIIPFEDTYGSHPDDLKALFTAAFEAGADGICLCDTCSRGYTPDWTKNLIRYVGHTIGQQHPGKIWEVHTHNMLGDSVTNALTAYNEGLVMGVHGTLGGVGDLGGNMPLEQFILHAQRAGYMQVPTEQLTHLPALVSSALAARQISPAANPYTGSIYSDAARYVPTGVHASAFKRLQQIGPHMGRIFEHVYFPFSPTELGLEIRLDIVTPVSGKSNVIALAHRLNVLEKLNDTRTAAILNSARSKGAPLTEAEFLSHF